MEADVIRQHAVELILGLRAFQPGGKYDMLARHTEVDISGSELVYLDLEADEMEDDVGLMMQLLFNMVYERAKTEDKKVVFALDEAHVLMDDKDTLNMLSRAVRHARHYDLSINFITQQPEDFFKSDKSKTIADNCSIKVVHKVGGMDEKIAKAIGLPSSHIQRARGLRTGKQRGTNCLECRIQRPSCTSHHTDGFPRSSSRVPSKQPSLIQRLPMNRKCSTTSTASTIRGDVEE
jgi:hypothetical protein